MENQRTQTQEGAAPVITPEELLAHWQGHRRLTRRVIESFPEDKLFSYSIGGMRPFAELALEMIGMAASGVQGVSTGNWQHVSDLPHHAKKSVPTTREEILRRWDEATEQVDQLWPQIPPHRFQEVVLAFGQYEGTAYSTLLYLIDNEIHHRGQGYVYLRSLGIEPPYFWARE